MNQASTPSAALVEQAEYLVDLGSTLLSYGCPTHRLEALMSGIAAVEGYTCDVFAVPTGLWMMLRPASGGDPPVVRMVRVKEWEVNLDRLSEVDRIFNDVLERKYTLADARRAIDLAEVRPAPYAKTLSLAAIPVASAASAVFFRGGLIEVLVAGLGGVLLVLLAQILRKREGAALLADFIGGLLAGCLAWAATTLRPELSREVVILSVIITLVPGMTMTTGLAELANRNLVSGAGRLMGAMTVFLSIIFGIATVIAIEHAIGVKIEPAAERVSAPLGLELAALLAGAFAFTVMFAVPPKYAPWAMLAAAISWLITGLAEHLPSGLAAFLGSLSVCLFANACARITKRPSQVFMLPGLILLVPGSFGFLSLEAFLRGNFLHGAAKGFEMFLVAGAIVTGLLLANVIFPARKFL